MAEISKKVENHFHKTYKKFDSYYEADKGKFSTWIDETFRQSMRLRFERVIEEVAPYEDKTVLDVGCGTGRYCFALARKGIQSALGVDFAENMIQEANNNARQLKLERICSFMQMNFLSMEIDEPFDHVFAMGVLDYVDQPVPFVKKMVDASYFSAIISFPSKGGIIQWLRKQLFRRIKRCPVYFYSEDEVRQIAREAGGKDFIIEMLAKDYLLIVLR